MDVDDLERLVDSDGLATVLSMLEDICHKKADHIESYWQDQRLKSKWFIAGEIMGKAHLEVKVRVGI